MNALSFGGSVRPLCKMESEPDCNRAKGEEDRGRLRQASNPKQHSCYIQKQGHAK